MGRVGDSVGDVESSRHVGDGISLSMVGPFHRLGGDGGMMRSAKAGRVPVGVLVGWCKSLTISCLCGWGVVGNRNWGKGDVEGWSCWMSTHAAD